MGDDAELRLAKAVATQCAPETAWSTCSGDRPALVETKLTVLDVNLQITCSHLAEKEKGFIEVLTQQTRNEAVFNVLSCQEKACDGRRLTEGAHVKLLVQTTGSN